MPLSGQRPDATIVITTKNRKEELRGAIASALAQEAAVEVLVFDDGSTDGTSELVCSEFPLVRLVRQVNSHGYIPNRNRAATMACADIVFSLDDDAAFSTPLTVSQTLEAFDHPRVGAVAIPFVNVNQGQAVLQQAPSGDGVFATATYIGTAHAVRRDLFLSLGGYREHFIHQGEEMDFCLRMLARGYIVRLGSADPIHHFESPKRDFRRMDYYGRRNDILFAWHNIPMPDLAVHLPATTLNGLRCAARVGRYRMMLLGLLSGWWTALTWNKGRQPVPSEIARLFKSLKRGGPCALDAIEAKLASLEPREKPADPSLKSPSARAMPS
jgi:GT2 family glycosyltransferase